MQPTSVRYAFEVGSLCSTFLIGFSYAAVSPIVALGATCCFFMGWVLWRYAVLYIYSECGQDLPNEVNRL